jgi:hypothetical protein
MESGLPRWASEGVGWEDEKVVGMQVSLQSKVSTLLRELDGLVFAEQDGVTKIQALRQECAEFLECSVSAPVQVPCCCRRGCLPEAANGPLMLCIVLAGYAHFT